MKAEVKSSWDGRVVLRVMVFPGKVSKIKGKGLHVSLHTFLEFSLRIFTKCEKYNIK